MPQMLDLEFFAAAADNAETFAQIQAIRRQQERMLRDNEMLPDATEVSLSLRGREIRLEACSAVNALEIYQEMFKDSFHGVLSEFNPDPDTNTIVDLGANYGFFALWAKERSPNATVLCVEPNRYIYPFMVRNLDGLENIRFENKAVGAKDGWQDFDFVRQVPSIAGKTLRMTERVWLDKALISTQRVETVSLETLLKNHGLEVVDILKVDIEGAEGELLAGVEPEIISGVERIVIEWHSPELRAFLLSRLPYLGFELVYDPDPACTKYYGNLFFVNGARRSRAK